MQIWIYIISSDLRAACKRRQNIQDLDAACKRRQNIQETASEYPGFARRLQTASDISRIPSDSRRVVFVLRYFILNLMPTLIDQIGSQSIICMRILYVTDLNNIQATFQYS